MKHNESIDFCELNTFCISASDRTRGDAAPQRQTAQVPRTQVQVRGGKFPRGIFHPVRVDACLPTVGPLLER